MASPRSTAAWNLAASLTATPPERLSTVVAVNIRWEAARYDLRQEDFAHLLDRSRTAISQRFTGRVPWTLDEIGRIAEALGLKPGYFLQEPVDAAWRAAGQ